MHSPQRQTDATGQSGEDAATLAPARARPAHADAAADRGWRCRSCATKNPPGWQVCRACGAARPRGRSWLRSAPLRPLWLLLGTLAALALGVWVLNAWTVVVGGGPWLVPAVLLWTLLVLAFAGVLWQRGR